MKSVLSQSYTDYEYIVVDGASADGSIELIQSFEPLFAEHMRWLSEPDKGIYDAMNKGIRMSTGDVIGFLNSDDYYYDADVLKHIAEAFEKHQEADAIHGNLHYINAKEKIVRTWIGTPYKPGAFQKGWNPAHPTFYCKRHHFLKFGGFDLNIGNAADFELMLRFLEKHQIHLHYINRFMVFMRTGGVSTSGFKSIFNNTRQNKQAFRKNNLPVPWHYNATRMISKILSLKKPISYFHKGKTDLFLH